jgi:selenocysteine lyase/cysteine desulfurase
VKPPAAHDTAESAAYAEFLEAHADYRGTASLDALRASDYGRLDASRHAYLDYTGGGLHAESQISDHARLLAREVFGNPHSASLASATTTGLVEQTRRHVLAYFNAASEYTAVFTLNATAALKLVGESYPFGPGGRFLLSFDNHNSVNGIREFASARGASRFPIFASNGGA